MVFLLLNLHTVAIKLITPNEKKKKTKTKKVQSVRRRPPGIFKEVSRNGEKAYWRELQQVDYVIPRCVYHRYIIYRLSSR